MKIEIQNIETYGTDVELQFNDRIYSTTLDAFDRDWET